MSHISSVKKDMIILEKSEFSSLKHEYEVRSVLLLLLSMYGQYYLPIMKQMQFRDEECKLNEVRNIFNLV
jgi:hypothetical protein